MSSFVPIIQVAIALAILNVWLLRDGKATNDRGGSARSLREQFAVDGLPGWFMGVAPGSSKHPQYIDIDSGTGLVCWG